jgi:predicted peroxiredoxin
MKNESQKLVVSISHGGENELSTVGFTIANGGLANDQDVSIFLTSNGVDIVRKNAIDTTQVEPFSPLKTLVDNFIEQGGTIWACSPCVKGRGYTDADFIDGVIVTGASPMLEEIGNGAATLSF